MSNNLPKKNGNLQCHLAFLQKAKERRRWSVASIPSSGYGTNTPASSSNSQCSLNTEDHYSCTCLHSTHHSHHNNHSQTNTTISASPKLYHSGIAGTLAQHYSSNDSNPSLVDDEGRLLSTQLPYFRPRSRSLSSPVRSPALDSKSNLDSSTSKENLINIQTPVVPGTLTFRRRSRSLSSPIRSPNVENRFVQMNYVYKERFPNAINQMNEKLEKFIQDNPELIHEVASDAVTRFVHHQAIEMARDCLSKSKDELLTSHYFHEMSDSLEKLMSECVEKSSTAAQHLKKLIKQLLIIVSRPARLLECLEFNPEEFYRFLEAAEGQATIQGIKTDLPQYIISKLGLTKEIQNEFIHLNERLEEKIDTKPENKQIEQQQQSEPVKAPNEKDYETIKLISNGAYGAVYLVKHKETNQRYAMKKINKQNLALRNQIEQAFAERDIMCFTDNPFVVSLFCSFETKLYLCMVMEYVEGGDCATLLKNMGPLPVDLAKFYFAETVLAVEYLHSYGIIHRDLKPANLLITALGHIKLTDFGLSKIGLMNLATNLYEGFIDRETKQFNDNQVCGTAEYIAPEVILRQGYGKPVDWWSMGVILYELLIGVVPFFSENGTAEELFSHVVNDEIEWPSDDDWPLPEEAKLIITQLLMPNPIDRLGTGGAAEVKDHPFFNGINFYALLRQKAEFVPQLTDEYDTSYFDTRLDRYNHELEDSEGLNDSDDSPLFSSFSSCSPRYHRMYSKLDDEKRQSSSTLSIMGDSASRKSSAEEKEINKSLIKSSLSVEEPSTSNLSSTNAAANKKEMRCKKDLNEELLGKLASGNNKDDKEDGNFLSSTFTHDSSQTESEDYSPLVQRRRKTMDCSKEMPKFNIEMPVKEELEHQQQQEQNEQKRPLTPSIKETPPDDSINEVECNSNELIYDENRLSLQSTKMRPVIKSASASSLSQLPEQIKTPQQRRFTQPDDRNQLDESSGMFSDNSTTSSVPDQTELIRNCLNKNLLSRLDSTPSKQLSTRNSLNVRKSSLRQMSSPYGSSASSRDNSPNHDLISKRKGSIESYNCDKRRSTADISLSSSFTNLSKLKPPVILRKGKSTRGYGFSFKAIRVYYGDSDVYTVHHLVLNVEPNSPAFEAGLKAGDLITHINSEPLQGLLHHQVLQLVLSAGEKIEIRTTPLESTSIKSGGRKRNPLVIKLAKRGMNRHHLHRKSSAALFAANEQMPGGIASLSPAVLKRNDSDKRRKNTNLFRRLSSKRASADMHQFLTASSCLNENQSCLTNAITPSKSFQYLTSNNGTNSGTKEACQTPTASSSRLDTNDPTTNKAIATNLNTTPHNQKIFPPHPLLHHQCSISDSSSDSSVPQSPLTTGNLSNCSNCSNCLNVSTPLTAKAQQQQQSISAAAAAAQFNRPNTLHGLKYKLVQTFRSPRRKSCGSITIPLSPLARNERVNSPCANCCLNQQNQASNLMTISPTRSPSPLAFTSGNSQQSTINHRHSHHFHRHRHSQVNCHQLQSNCCLNSNCKQLVHHAQNVNEQQSAANSNNLSAIDVNLNTSLNSSTNCKKSLCSSHCMSSRLPANDLDLYGAGCGLDKSTDSKIVNRSKSAEPEATLPTIPRRVSCACDQYDQIVYDNQCFGINRHCNCIKSNLKIKKCNCFTQSPLALSPTASHTKPCLNESINQQSQADTNQSEAAKTKKDEIIKQESLTSEKDSESSTASNCSVMTITENKLNETIETIPECSKEEDESKKDALSNASTKSPSKKQSSSPSSNQESTFSKVKKSIGSPINIRKTLFKSQSGDSRKGKGSSFKSKDSKGDSKEQKD